MTLAHVQQHVHTRYPGIVDPGINQALWYHTDWDGGSYGNYVGPGIAKPGGLPVNIDFGDGSGGLLGVAQTYYLDNSIKPIKIWSPQGWTGVTGLYGNWGHGVGGLPNPAFLADLTEYVFDNNSFTGSIPSFSRCPGMQNIHIETNQLTGSVPSFVACTGLQFINMSNNSGLSGTLPSFNACTALQEFRCGGGAMTGVLPSFGACSALTLCEFDWNHFTSVASGCFTTQPNLNRLTLYECSFGNTAIDALLDQLITSLSVPSRVTCFVALDGGGMGVPNAGKVSTLEAAGWTIYHN